MLLNKIPLISLLVGLWLVINGILHDIFVLREHQGPYDRNLLRLLLDGHILMTCGLMLLLAYPGMKENQTWAFAIGILATASILVYCGMIFPFLKSMVTMILNLFLLILLLVKSFSGN